MCREELTSEKQEKASAASERDQLAASIWEVQGEIAGLTAALQSKEAELEQAAAVAMAGTPLGNAAKVALPELQERIRWGWALGSQRLLVGLWHVCLAVHQPLATFGPP